MAATRTITINRCFAYRDAAGTEHYFTPTSNPADVVKLLDEDALNQRIKSGVISTLGDASTEE